ncbi:hypothetical protein [Pseudaestuariivita atlantica]|nr:hypothetical protein [Pseudaestuariivita atlantica]
MRPATFIDVTHAARLLMAVPRVARGEVCDGLIAQAGHADKYRKRFGRAHARLGTGTLSSRIGPGVLPTEPVFCDRLYARCLALVFERLARRDQPR